ncbi:MFS transporter [Bacillus sp. EB600]|uniref:MFS transporter n=1 Tax=Bacillus sp. EB600 TaxID=2806345 RepID=UPI00210E8A61|nr:MFS transporter [Bacillus sp. EB600]MCQ6282573.1 MFS transporter [Bacillus sp. EB600]
MEKETVTFVRTKRALNYGYFIVALSFIALFASMGIRGSFGTYVTGWEQTFSVNRVWVSIVSFMSLLVYGISIVAAGKLTDQIGSRKVLTISMILISSCLLGSFFAVNIWHIMLLYGFIGSIGFGFASNVTVSVAIVKWFKEKKSFMVSIVVVGMAAGPMIFGPLNIYLMDQMGWKSTFILYGAIIALLLIPLFALFYRDSPEQGFTVQKKSEVGKTEHPHFSLPKLMEGMIASFSIFCYPVTWIISFAYFICGFTDVGLIYTHLVPLGESWGLSPSIISNTMLLYGISNIVATITIGYISDKFSDRKLLSLLYVIRLAALLVIIFLHEPIWLLIFALFYGFTDIATIAPFTMICSKIFGEKNIGSAFGMISFFHQLGAAAGALIPGLLFSLSSNYQSSLCLSAFLVALNVILVFNINEQNKILK